MPAVIDQLFSVWGFIGLLTVFHLINGSSDSQTRKYLFYTNLAMLACIAIATTQVGVK
jgi:hypothetical protein